MFLQNVFITPIDPNWRHSGFRKIWLEIPNRSSQMQKARPWAPVTYPAMKTPPNNLISFHYP